MKSFKQLIEEKLNEGNDRYPADEMTMKELKIACYAAQNILDMLEDGAMIQRWQISAIVKASEELSSVYTSISTDEQDYYGSDEWEDEEEPQYVGFEYPSMFEEKDNSTSYVVKGKSPFYKQDHFLNTSDPRVHVIKKHIKHATRMSQEDAMKHAKDWEKGYNPNKYKAEVVKVEK